MRLFRGITLHILIFQLAILSVSAQVSKQQIQSFNTRQSSGFTENKGQITDQHGNVRNDVKFIYSAQGLNVFFKENSFSYELYTVDKKYTVESKNYKPEMDVMLPGKYKKPEDITVKSNRIDVNLPGANKYPEIIAEGKSKDFNNYYLAHTQESGVQQVFNYTRLTYKNVWPKVDIVFYAKKDSELKYDIIVHPGGDISKIAFLYEGTEFLKMNEGVLKIKTSLGIISETIPTSFINESKESINIDYNLLGNKISFTGKYDRSQTLIIDPLITWSTYFGGTGSDIIRDIKNYGSGIYAAGYTNSANSIATSGAYQTSYNTSTVDAFISKFDTSGQLKWSTYYGGTSFDEAGYIAVSKGYLYIGGRTWSTTGIATSGAHQTSHANTSYMDAFIVKFDTSGARKWGTYYGGFNEESLGAINCDTVGNVFIAGYTLSTSMATSGAHQAVYGGNSDAFIAKFNSSGTRQWSTYFGGSSYESMSDLNTDLIGNIYITGLTGSSDSIASTGSHQTAYMGNGDAFIAKFSNYGKREWSTYYGGSGMDCGVSLEIYKDSVYFAGYTYSADSIASAKAFQTKYGGNIDAFLVKMSNAGVRKWGTYYGNYGNDLICDITLDNSGRIYLTGSTTSDSLATKGAFQFTTDGSEDIFISQFDARGNLRWGTYYGDYDNEQYFGADIDASNSIYITGLTEDTTFFGTPGSYQDSSGGSQDAFITKFAEDTEDAGLSNLKGMPNIVCLNDSIELYLDVENFYSQPDSNVIIKAQFTGPDTLDFIDSLIIAGHTKDSFILGSKWHFTKAGTYKLIIYLAQKDDYASNDTIYGVLQVNKNAIPKFTFATDCNDTTISFSNNSLSCSGAMKYLWDFGDGDTSSKQNPVKKYTKAGNYKVKLIAYTSAGKDTLIKTIKYYPKPTADFTFTPSCQDTAISFKNTSIVAADSLAKYIWSFGDGDSSTLKNPIHQYDSAGIFDVKLIVVMENGCTDTVSRKVELYPKPDIDFYSPSTECTDNEINFYNSSTVTKGSIVLYKWRLGDGRTSTFSSPFHIYQKAGTYTVTLIATTSFGCVDSLSKTFVIYDKPNSDFNYTASCEGDSVYFTNTSKINSGSIVNYKWVFPTGDTSGLKDPAYVFKKAGHYSVKLITTSNNGCKDSNSKSVVVYDRPKVKFSANNACMGESISFKDSTLNLMYGMLSSYYWDFGDGTTSTDKNPAKAFLKEGIYAVKLKAMSSNSCSDSFTKNIEIYAKPLVSFISPNTCAGEQISFTNTSSVISGNIKAYLWDFGDGDTSTLENPAHNYDSAGTYIVTLKATTSNGCQDFLTDTITIYPRAKAGFVVNDACAGSNISFANASTINKGKIAKYEWHFGDGDTSNLENPEHIYLTAGKYNVTLIVTSDMGCVDSISDSITIYQLPVAQFETNNVCQSEEATFTSNSLLATEWLWDFGDSSTSTSENPTHKYFSAGTYMVKLKVKSINGCTDSISKEVEIYELPEAIFSVNNICVTDSFALTDSSKGATNWFWDFGDGYTATLQHPKHKYDKAGKYNIYLTASNSNGCSHVINRQIEVYDMPKANFSVSDICLTDNLQIIDSSQHVTSWLWNFGDNTSSASQKPIHAYSSAGTYTISLKVINNVGCVDQFSQTVTVHSDCVWPGDANADKIVDNKDILAIGIAYSDSGSTRTDTSTAWKGNIVTDWSNSFSGGANYKHADSDGNGIVTNTDTLAITRNYTKTHAKKRNTNRGKNTDPLLKIEIQNDSLKAGDTLIAYIVLGENALPAKDVYGIAFSLDYNESIFYSPVVNFSDSWFGKEALGYSNTTNGLDIAMTRTDQKNISGAGKIAAIELVMKNDVFAEIKDINLEITDNILISADEHQIPVNVEDDSVRIYKEPSSVYDNVSKAQAEINVYPNPFNNQTLIEFNLIRTAKVNITLYDINGRAQLLMAPNSLSSGKYQFLLDADKWLMGNGIHILKVEIDGLPVYKRVIKL